MDFIEVYEGVLAPEACAQLIGRFDAAGQAQRGSTGGGVDVSLKDSWDISLDTASGWADVRQQLNDAMLKGFTHYLRRYAHVALAPLQLKMQKPDGQMALVDADLVASMNDELLAGLIAKVFRPGGINIQKYLADQGGYPYWHSEQYPKRGDNGDALHRALLWTIYLNDEFEEGETEFLYQQRRIVPRTGSLLIAPGGFTHTHRGNRPKGGNKYIATSWVLYQRAESLFAT
ncbi:2OG-Fe(II) oxygenase [Pelomonas sp. KK5]|uniref:2OG-Fe(II) oxygenase n=1 Tax=Pelomonas sp. KK5 TaxID=1855730 RepID=UPI0018EA2E4F|nr:2OG-Fe(II) oxygenase [Pelomonas sp. KK5]